MAKSISNTLIWIIAIIALLAFIGVIYLLVKDLSSNGDTIYVFSGNAVSNGGSDSNPLSCTMGDHRTCSAAYGGSCRRAYGGNYNSYCASRVGDRVTCECIANVV